ncbi:MAG: sulfotransferase [Myxococcales bacterium]|nr:sulfotransferase [Myxococcales bacterium]
MDEVVTHEPVAFVLGVARSGTTLLRLMLAGHPQVFSPPELVLAPFETMAQRHALLERRFWEKGGLRRTFMELEGLDVDAAKAHVAGLRERTVPEVYRELLARIGPRILVDKCPHLVSYPEALPRLQRWFPAARFLWIVRNPGSVIRSFNNVNMSERLLDGSPYQSVEQMWREGNALIGDFLATVPAERWLRFSYEDLVRAPEPVLRRICDTLGVGYDPAMATPYEGDRMRAGPKGARAVGDPNTATRSAIEPALAERWLAGFDHRTLDASTKALALELGYDLQALPLPAVAQVSGALGGLLDVVRAIEAGIELPQDLDDLEGRRFLLRMLCASVDTFTEYSDPDWPRLHHVIGPTRKMFGDCPDSDCLRARVQLGPGRAYRLTGRIPPGTTYVGLLLHRKGGVMGNHLDDRALDLDADGRFTVWIASDDALPAEGTVLRGHGDETELMIRQYYADRGAEAPIELQIELQIERPRPAPLQPAAYARGLELAGAMLTTTFQRIRGAHQTITGLPIKRFYTMPGERLFPTPDNTYQVCWYRFGPRQAFVVRGRLPAARYYGLCLYNAWLESLDYTRHTISLNHAQLQTDTHGRFCVVLAAEDPGVPNWLDTAGHDAGYLLARSLLLEGAPTELRTETVWLDELAERLAADA